MKVQHDKQISKKSNRFRIAKVAISKGNISDYKIVNNLQLTYLRISYDWKKTGRLHWIDFVWFQFQAFELWNVCFVPLISYTESFIGFSNEIGDFNNAFLPFYLKKL